MKFEIQLPFVSRKTHEAVVKDRDEYKHLLEMVIGGKRPSDEELDGFISENPGSPAGLRKMAQTAALRKAGRLA